MSQTQRTSRLFSQFYLDGSDGVFSNPGFERRKRIASDWLLRGRQDEWYRHHRHRNLNAKGKRLALADQSDHERVFGAPSVTIRRGTLVEILLAQARATGVDARFNVRMTGVAASSDRVRLALSDGASYDADILVGADGLRSSVREIVFPKYPRPHYTGLIGTGGITEAEIPDTGGLMRMTFGSNAFFGYLKPAGQPVYWFDSYAADQSDIEKINNPTGYAREIRALHANDPSPNADILDHVEVIERSSQRRSDREDCQGCRRGRRHAIYLLRQQGRAAEPVISKTQDGPSGRHDDRLRCRQEPHRPESPRLGSLHRLGFGTSLEAESDEATGGVRPHHRREQEARQGRI
jgi:hypothetical protein